MRFSASFLQDIRDRVPIADVVGRRVTFDRKKSNQARGDFWGCCPFHGEKTPSFHCENAKGRYYCFGCGASGDHFRFLTELDGLSFPEAVERLADEAGVAMPAYDPQMEAREKEKASLFDVMDLALQFFRDQLQTAEGAKARAYLRDRGLSPSTQNEFGLGYAPPGRNVLKEYLSSKGVSKEQIEACGLVVFGPEIPVSYDRFRDRIMFPIPDARERVIAFGGRAMSADAPAKYLNSPETELFSKSNVLYNYARARKAADRQDNLVVAEGYIDVIALHAAGFRTAVAPLGTALTTQQLELAWRVGGEPVLCFDGDEAGTRAAWRSVDTALPGLKPGRSMRFALLPHDKDPDDLIAAGGPEAFREVLDGARPLADMLWSRETAGRTFDTPERRAELERSLFAVVAQIGDDSVKRHYQQDIRDRLQGFFGLETGGPKAGARRDGARQRGHSGRNAPGARGRLAVTDSLMNSSLVRRQTAQPPLREAALIVTIVNHPAIGLAHFDELAALDIDHDVLQHVYGALLDTFAVAGDQGRIPAVAEVRQALEERGVGSQLDILETQVRQTRIWQAMAEAAFEDARDGWLQAHALHTRSRALNKDLKAAERAFEERGDEASFNRLVVLKQEIARDDGTEALIEGFGLSSGRPVRNF